MFSSIRDLYAFRLFKLVSSEVAGYKMNFKVPNYTFGIQNEGNPF